MESAQAAEVPAVGKLSNTTLLAGLLLLVGAVVFLWYAPNSYQVYKALHVISIVIWVGGDVTLTTLGIVFERRNDGPTLAALGKMGTWIGTRVYTPALFAVLAFGIALMQKGNWDWWGVFWIDFGLAGWLIAAMRRRRLRRARAGPDRQGRPGVRAAIGRGRPPRAEPLHDLPLRHGAARPDRARHGREAVVLNRHH